MSERMEAVEVVVDGAWKAVEEVRFSHMWDAPEVCDQDITLEISSDLTCQTITGIGGAFSEIGYQALEALPEDTRNDVIQQLFGPAGASLNFCRVPIGSSDFAIDAYSHSETPEDYEMAHFSLARDEGCLLRFVRAAKAANPALKLHASPWSPPGWLKTNGQVTGGGKLREDPRVYQAYARYLRRFIEGYAAHGCEVSRLVIQNEPECGKDYPTCCMPPEQMVEFTVNYLVPEFQSAGLATELWSGTHTRLGGLYPAHCLADNAYAHAIKGLGFQYELPERICDLARGHAHLGVMHTESNCYMGLNQLVESVALFADFWDYMTAGCDNFSYWNMVLNETRQSGWGWRQNSLVVIDRESGAVDYTPDYYVMRLLARSIRPGAQRIGIHCLHLRHVLAFRNPDETVTVVLHNTAAAKKATFHIDGALSAELDIPGHSLIAVTLG